MDVSVFAKKVRLQLIVSPVVSVVRGIPTGKTAVILSEPVAYTVTPLKVTYASLLTKSQLIPVRLIVVSSVLVKLAILGEVASTYSNLYPALQRVVDPTSSVKHL